MVGGTKTQDNTLSLALSPKGETAQGKKTTRIKK